MAVEMSGSIWLDAVVTIYWPPTNSGHDRRSYAVSTRRVQRYFIFTASRALHWYVYSAALLRYISCSRSLSAGRVLQWTKQSWAVLSWGGVGGARAGGSCPLVTRFCSPSCTRSSAG